MTKKTHVTFVEPRGSYSNVFSKYMTIPMLGPLYLATIAEQAGYSVTILNENILGRKIMPHELRDVDILCLSCMTTTVERGKEIAREYKAMRHSASLQSRTIIGGIHASMIPDDVINDFDQVFIGEAETRIVDVLSGAITDKIIHGERIKNLDIVPIPNFRLLKNWEKIRVWPIMTSRGCPYNCTFCSVTEMFGRGYRTKSVEKVIEEVKVYKKYWIFFVDDHFIVNKNRTNKLLDQIKTNNLHLKFSCQIRAQVSRDRGLISRMRGAGCRTVYIGFESINPKSLEEMKKGQTVEDIRSSIKVFRDNFINVHGMFILGNDSDTKDTFTSTSQFCKKNGLSSVQYAIITPLPGTVFYKKIETEGRLLHKKWEFFDGLHVVFNPQNFTPAELQQGMIDCFGDFYSYANAFNDAINIFFKTIWASLKSMFKKVYFPSVSPSILKIAGKPIVKRWVKFNKPYLRYLDILSLSSKIKSDNKAV